MAENRNLKAIVSDKIPEEVSSKLLAECNSEIPSRISMHKKESDLISNGSVNPGLSKHALISTDREYMQSLQCAQRSFIITDPSLPDNPIMFASPGFLELTKYSLDDVKGRNCRFLQGPRTNPGQLGVLRKGIVEGKDTSVTLLNYKKDGTAFWNQIFVAGLKNAVGKIVNYVGVQSEVKNPGYSAEFSSSSGASIIASDEGLRRGMRSETAQKSGIMGMAGVGGVAVETGLAQPINLPLRPGGGTHGLRSGVPIPSISAAASGPPPALTNAPNQAATLAPASASVPASGTATGLGDEIFDVGEGFTFNTDSSMDFRFTMGDDSEQAAADGTRRQRGGSLSLPGTRLTPVSSQGGLMGSQGRPSPDPDTVTSESGVAKVVVEADAIITESELVKTITSNDSASASTKIESD